MKTGDTVRLKQPEIIGPVLKRRINEASDTTELLVAYEDEAGQVNTRWFDERLLELAPTAPSEPAETDTPAEEVAP